jgi:phosphoglycerate dehydrogenase-like enzyme
MIRILITPRSLTSSPGQILMPLEAAGFELTFAPRGRQPTEAELLGLVSGCTGWLAGVEPISARVFDAADRLKVISRNGSGIDSIDLDAAKRHGVKVMVAAGANAGAVAELALALTLAALRHIPESISAIKAGRWHRREGRELGGATVGIIGCGSVGRRFATAIAALGGSLALHDVAPDRSFRPDGEFAWTDLDRLVETSDVISLHCPALPHNATLLDAERLTRVKKGVGIVNTARASLVDERVMAAALDSGRVGWYATDVFAEEPPARSALLYHERVIATPHIGGFTAEGGRRAARTAVEHLIAELGNAKSRCEATGANTR